MYLVDNNPPEVVMFARTVSLQLKPNSVAEFTKTIENDLIPLLRKQPGFQDEMVFVVPGGTEAVAISVWEQHEHAEASARGTSPHVLQAVAKVVEGTPQVSTSEVANSTFHKSVPRVAI
jgi:heme-degrading monooxygenase HmoA